jgi:3-hydroxyacyl-[acyl-carrier-protein] dehydratase
VALEPGVAATATLLITTDSPGFPPLLLLEAIAQLGGIAAGQQEGEGGVLAAIERAELPLAVRVGDRVTVEARIVKGFGRFFLVEGKAHVGGEVIAQAMMTLAVGSFSEMKEVRRETIL